MGEILTRKRPLRNEKGRRLRDCKEKRKICEGGEKKKKIDYGRLDSDKQGENQITIQKAKMKSVFFLESLKGPA